MQTLRQSSERILSPFPSTANDSTFGLYSFEEVYETHYEGMPVVPRGTYREVTGIQERVTGDHSRLMRAEDVPVGMRGARWVMASKPDFWDRVFTRALRRYKLTIVSDKDAKEAVSWFSDWVKTSDRCPRFHERSFATEMFGPRLGKWHKPIVYIEGVRYDMSDLPKQQLTALNALKVKVNKIVQEK